MAQGLEGPALRLLRDDLRADPAKWAPCAGPATSSTRRGPSGSYEDLHFWTGIDECESYGADFLTGNKHTRADYEKIDPNGKAFLKPVHWRQQPNPPTEEFPFVLNTGRVVYHFHTRTKTGRVDGAEPARAACLCRDSSRPTPTRLSIELGDLVEITSPHGRWEGPAMVVDTVRPGRSVHAVPLRPGIAMQLTSTPGTRRDPVSQQPQFKSSPVALRRLSFGQPEPWLLERLAELNGKFKEPFASLEFGGTVNRTVQAKKL